MKTAISSLLRKIVSLPGRVLSFFGRVSGKLRLSLPGKKAQVVTRREPVAESKAGIRSRIVRVASAFRRLVSYPRKVFSFLHRLLSFLRRLLFFLRRLFSPLRKVSSLLARVGRRLWLLMPGKRLLRAVFRRRPVSVRQRYYYVRYATSVVRIIAWVVLVIGIIASLAWGITTGGLEGGLQIAVGMVGSFLAWLALLVANELLKLLVDLKDNTENTAEGAFTIMKQG